MRKPSDLTKEELERVVERVRDALWMGDGGFDPDKEWGPDDIEAVAQVLADAGLRPDEATDFPSICEEAAAKADDLGCRPDVGFALLHSIDMLQLRCVARRASGPGSGKFKEWFAERLGEPI